MSDLTPRNNPEFFGHEDAWALLENELASGKLAHGLLITGPKGIGKATLAYRLARLLLTPSPLEGEGGVGGEGHSDFDVRASLTPHPNPPPQGGRENAVFRRIAAGSHSDLLVIEQEYDAKKEEISRDISVDQARQAAEFLSLTPGEGAWRVVIIDSVDALNMNGANAILKILEEPPRQTILILISHNPGKLLPTIRSRCRTLKLAPLKGDDFRRIVRHAQPEMDYSEMQSLEILSGGSPGVALELKAKEALEWYGQMLELLADAPMLNALKLHAFADQIGFGTVHENWQVFTRLMLCLLERTAKTAAGMALEEAVAGEGGTLARLASIQPAGIWAAKWQHCADQFLLAQARHLDYKQVVITWFNSILEEQKQSLVDSR